MVEIKIQYHEQLTYYLTHMTDDIFSHQILFIAAMILILATVHYSANCTKYHRNLDVTNIILFRGKGFDKLWHLNSQMYKMSLPSGQLLKHITSLLRSQHVSYVLIIR